MPEHHSGPTRREIARDGAGLRVDHPAVDASGLEGGFDFALSWTPRGNFDGGQRGQAPGGGGASEPNGALSLFEGVQRRALAWL